MAKSGVNILTVNDSYDLKYTSLLIYHGSLVHTKPSVLLSPVFLFPTQSCSRLTHLLIEFEGAVCIIALSLQRKMFIIIMQFVTYFLERGWISGGIDR